MRLCGQGGKVTVAGVVTIKRIGHNLYKRGCWIVDIVVVLIDPTRPGGAARQRGAERTAIPTRVAGVEVQEAASRHVIFELVHEPGVSIVEALRLVAREDDQAVLAEVRRAELRRSMNFIGDAIRRQEGFYIYGA